MFDVIRHIFIIPLQNQRNSKGEKGVSGCATSGRGVSGCATSGRGVSGCATSGRGVSGCATCALVLMRGFTCYLNINKSICGRVFVSNISLQADLLVTLANFCHGAVFDTSTFVQ